MPGHPDELERRARARPSRATTASTSGCPRRPTRRRCTRDGLTVLRRGSQAAPVVVAVGPTLDETLAATRDLDVTVAYLATVRPFDADGLRALVRGTDVVLVEPYLAGTSAGRGHRGARRPPAPAAVARRRERRAAPLRQRPRPPRRPRPRRRRASAARSQDSSTSRRSRLCRLLFSAPPLEEQPQCPLRRTSSSSTAHGRRLVLERRHRAPAGRRLQRHRAAVPDDRRSPTTSPGCARCCACRTVRPSSPATPTAVRS